MSDVHLLLEALSRFPNREMRVEYREFLQLRQGGEEERRGNPACLARADYVGEGEGFHWYRYESADTKLREEEQVLLLNYETDEEVASTKIGRLDLVRSQIGFKKLKTPPQRIVVLAKPQGENKFLAQALEALAADPEAYPLVGALLRRSPCPGQGLPPLERVCMDEPGYLVVQGPPGAGKTTLAGAAIARLLKEGRKVGIMAPSHRAINELLSTAWESWQELGLSPRVLKAYSKDRDRSSVPGVDNVTGSDLVRNAPSADVLAGTVYQWARMETAIDTLFVDEAGQTPLASAVGALRNVRRVVFLGDQQQLPHVSRAKHPEGAGLSLLDYLLQGASVVPDPLGVFLEQTWRMNDELTEFISSLMYEGRLQSAPAARDGRFSLSDDVDDPLGPCSLVFLGVEHQGNEQASEEEADVVATLVERIQAAGSDTKVVVVTAFRAQENRVRARLGTELSIGTVDKFQGISADVVIYTLGTSDPSLMPRDPEFLLSTHRLNVALSRARKKAILVASPRLLEVAPDSLRVMRLASALCRVRQFHRELQSRHRGRGHGAH